MAFGVDGPGGGGEGGQEEEDQAGAGTLGSVFFHRYGGGLEGGKGGSLLLYLHLGLL